MKWFSKKAHSDLRVRVEGLGEKELTSLYNTGKVTKVEPGEVLAKEGEKDRTIFLILNGAFRIVRENGTRMSQTDILKEGDWIGELIFSNTPQRISSIAATEPSSVLGINDSAFKALDHSIQSFILKRLNDQSMLRIRQICRSQRDAQSKSEYLTRYIQRQMHQRNQDYEQSEIISNMFKNLPRLPIHTTNLIQLLSDGNASAREITRLAKQDPSLVTEILKTVNSVYYSLHREISDIQYAITYLGFNQVYQIVISNGLRRSMPKTKEFKALHEHSVIIADLVFEICQLYNRRIAPTMSTIALLHDIGKSIVLLLKIQTPRLSFFVDMLDPAKIGATLLKGWNIPRKVHETIEYQDYPEFLPPSELPTEEKESVALLYIAHAAYEYILGNSDGILQNPFVEEYMQLLNFSGLSVGELMDKYIMIDLKLKADTLPKHVRSFILAKARAAKREEARAVQGCGPIKKYNHETMIDDAEW